MSNKRQYYIIQVPNPNSGIQHALEVSIGQVDTQRYSLDGSEVIIKTNAKLIKGKTDAGASMNILFPPGLTTAITYVEALVLTRTPDWQLPSDV